MNLIKLLKTNRAKRIIQASKLQNNRKLKLRLTKKSFKEYIINFKKKTTK